MNDFVDRLADLIVQDNAVLFVGNDLRSGADQPSAIQQIAKTLADRIQYNRPDASLHAVARDFEILHGRRGLILALREELEKQTGDPGEIYRLLADAVLPMTKVITTRFDHLIEQALDRYDKPYVLIVRDADVPFLDESKVTLIKMQGDIGQPESLVITEDDMETFIGDLPTLSDLIRAFFATKTLIFIGYDLNSAVFKRFYRQVSHNLSAFRRQAYAVLPEKLDDVEHQYWQQQNIDISVREPVDFLVELAEIVKRKVESGTSATVNPLQRLASPPLPEKPYKALESFDQGDVAIFAGRKIESEMLSNRMVAHRLTVLHGESGSGKTSLVSAGAQPRLAERGALIVVQPLASGIDLRKQLKDRLLAAGAEVGLPSADGDDLESVLRKWQARLPGPVVIVLDQFEQLLVSFNQDERQSIARWVQSLIAAEDLNLRLVIVLREDFLGQLQSLEEWIPGLFAIRFRLDRLGREAARAAIEEPASLFDVRWEAQLVDRLLDDLYEGSGAGIAPPQLQIVCSQLYEEVRSDDGREMLIDSELFDALGGTQGILGDYLEKTVQGIEQGWRQPARMLLGALVSTSGVKQRMNLDELARAADIPEEKAAAILNELSRKRIIRRFEEDQGDESLPTVAYELTHDYLALRITRWLGESFWAAQKAREVVRAALPDWKGEARVPAPADLRLAGLHMDEVRFSQQEAEMLYAAAVTYYEALERWRPELPAASRRDVLLRLLDHADPAARRGGAVELGEFADGEVAKRLAETALDDPVEEVRIAAASAIAALGHGDDFAAQAEAIERLVQAKKAGQPRPTAIQALTYARDLSPQVERHLPSGVRWPVRWRVWLRRLGAARHQLFQNTARGAIGGYLGLGLAFALQIYSTSLAGQVSLQTSFGILLFTIFSFGLPGAFLGAMLALANSLLAVLQDQTRLWLNWLLVSVVSAVYFGAVYAIVFGFGVAGEISSERVFTLTVLGFALAAAASIPMQNRTMSFGIAAIAGTAGWQLALAADWFQALSGALAGVILAWAVRRAMEMVLTDGFAKSAVMKFVRVDEEG